MAIKEFSLTVLDSWVEKVGLFLTILAFIEKMPRVREYLHEKPIIDRFVPVLWFIGMFCIIWGFYSAWLVQYRAAREAQKQLEELTQPNFEVVHGTVVTSDVVRSALGTSVRNTAVFMSVVVYNHGAPSIIKGWEFSAKLKDGREFTGIPWKYQSTKPITIAGPDMLPVDIPTE